MVEYRKESYEELAGMVRELEEGMKEMEDIMNHFYIEEPDYLEMRLDDVYRRILENVSEIEDLARLSEADGEITEEELADILSDLEEITNNAEKVYYEVLGAIDNYREEWMESEEEEEEEEYEFGKGEVKKFDPVGDVLGAYDNLLSEFKNQLSVLSYLYDEILIIYSQLLEYLKDAGDDNVDISYKQLAEGYYEELKVARSDVEKAIRVDCSADKERLKNALIRASKEYFGSKGEAGKSEELLTVVEKYRLPEEYDEYVKQLLDRFGVEELIRQLESVFNDIRGLKLIEVDEVYKMLQSVVNDYGLGDYVEIENVIEGFGYAPFMGVGEYVVMCGEVYQVYPYVPTFATTIPRDLRRLFRLG